MSDIQKKMYQHYLDNFAKGGPSNAGKRGKGAGLFADFHVRSFLLSLLGLDGFLIIYFFLFQELGSVWTHPKALLMAQNKRDLKAIAPSDEADVNKSMDDRSRAASVHDEVSRDESGDEEDPGKLELYPSF